MDGIVESISKGVMENCKQKDLNTRCYPTAEIMDVDLTPDIASLIPTISTVAATGDSSSNEANSQICVNTNVMNNDVVILLSDGEDEDNTKTDVQVRYAETVVQTNNKSGTATYSTESVVVNSDGNDSRVIMLDDSSRHTEVEVQNKTDSLNPEENSLRTCEKMQCINFDCKSNKKAVTFYNAPIWALNHFNVPHKVNRGQFVCQNCFDISVNDYERMCIALVNQQPLLMVQLPRRPEVVEIIDSEEEDNGGSSNKYADCTKPLSMDTLTVLEEHLEDVLKETFDRINVEQQMEWTNQILKVIHTNDTTQSSS